MPNKYFISLHFFTFLLLFIHINTLFVYKTADRKGCTLEANIDNWEVSRDFELLESMINRDIFMEDDSLKFGYYIHAIGLLKVDSSALNLKIKVDTIHLYGDDFGDKSIEVNFRKDYKDYIYKLIDEYLLKSDALDKECSFIIHSRKFRACT